MSVFAATVFVLSLESRTKTGRCRRGLTLSLNLTLSLQAAAAICCCCPAPSLILSLMPPQIQEKEPVTMIRYSTPIIGIIMGTILCR